MMIRSLLAIGCTAALLHPASAESDKARLQSINDPANPVLTAPIMKGDVTDIDARVVAIDPANRLVRLKSDEGRMATVMVGPEIANFDNLTVGDKVNARFTQAMAVALRKNSETDIRQTVESEGASQRRADGKPAIRSMEQKTVVANVFEIRPDDKVITLRGTSGEPVDYQVNDKQVLENIGEGDQVVISYVQASAISIEPDQSASNASNDGKGG